KSVNIDNSALVKDCMRRANFREVKVFPRKISRKMMTPYRDEKGRFTQDSEQRKVYADEFVVVGQV
ncbi:MAG: class I SAM-dependent methyltransferase, partial [Gammaproteobacteria bacterium]|nr:class I SAM-dependent methyltransferase [Gammaproteobacteria bacterium]